MRRLVLVMVMLLLGLLIGCASVSVPVEFDPTETPFEGEWVNWDSDYNKLIYKFTGNRWEFTYKDVHLTGLFTYTEKSVLFTNENGKWTQGYKFEGSYRFLLTQGSTGRQTGFGYFTKQPYGDLVNSYVTKEKSFSDIVSNEEELTSIQGSWRSQAKYTFSGDQFKLNALTGNAPSSGTIKIKDNILYFIVNNKLYGIVYLDLLPDNKIFLNRLWFYSDLWWGLFIKQ